MPRQRDAELLRALGRRVAECRKGRGYTQEALAEAVGIEPVTLSRLETGHRALSMTTLSKIATALRISLGDLVDVDRPQPEVETTPDEAELLRLFRGLRPDSRDVLLRLVRELSTLTPKQ